MKVIICIFIIIISLVIVELVPILKVSFPIDHVEAVLFTINQNVTGSENVIYYLVSKTLYNALYDICLFGILIAIILWILKRKKVQNFSKWKNRILQLSTFISLFAAVVMTVLSIPVYQYILVWYNSIKEPNHSQLYTNEYVEPRNVVFNNKKNLILLFLESMEFNFQDSANGGNLKKNRIPEITKYMNTFDSFKPGGESVFGTNWTMAAVVSKTCGIPLNYPPGIYHSVSGLKKFLPGAVCLSDILKENDYNVLFSQGSSKEFASMESFVRTHGNAPIYDVNYYLLNKRFQEKDKANWGISDRDLFELMKQDLDILAQQEIPFAYITRTADTHMPYGYMDPHCNHPSDRGAKELYPYILECSSMLLNQFLQWAKNQSWYENTTIAVMGDHETYVPAKAVGFSDTSITHRWVCFFINSSVQTNQYNRKYTSFDMLPTVLEAMGANVPNNALGLGRSLYSSKETLLEKYGKDSLNSLLEGRSIEYDKFLYQ
ncbi:MAG: sulfatase-like hydrolase/transferase [Fibrobacter sp.]|nr:sulfatase-like hydrolase/transferase [Fibrobacter sp.]